MRGGPRSTRPPRFRLQVLGLGASRLQLLGILIREARLPLLAALMAGFGAVISEVGALAHGGREHPGADPGPDDGDRPRDGRGNFDSAIALSVIVLTFTFLVNWALTGIQQRGRA